MNRLAIAALSTAVLLSASRLPAQALSTKDLTQKVEAQGATLVSLSEELSRMKALVAQLEERLAVLENSSSPSPAKVTTGTLWKNKANWRLLKNGMSMVQVRGLLGEPRSIRTSGPFTYWSYDEFGLAQVGFYNGTVDSWDEPR